MLAVALVAMGLFLQAWRRLRLRGRADLAPWTRLVEFTTGVVVGVLATVSPIDSVGEDFLQSFHMLQHVLLGDLSIALTVLAVRGPLAVFFLPPRVLAPLARTRSLRRTASFLLRPVVTFLVWAGVIGIWHVPAAYEAALRSTPLHDLEHVSFAVAGLLVWVQLIDPLHARRMRLRERAIFAGCLLWTVFVVAVAMVSTASPFYAPYVRQEHRLLGLDPVQDQRLAGAVMLVEQALTLVTFMAIALRLARRERARPETASAVGVPRSG